MSAETTVYNVQIGLLRHKFPGDVASTTSIVATHPPISVDQMRLVTESIETPQGGRRSSGVSFDRDQSTPLHSETRFNLPDSVDGAASILYQQVHQTAKNIAALLESETVTVQIDYRLRDLNQENFFDPKQQ